MAYTNNNGQVRIGVRSGITNSPIQQTTTVSASLLQSLYGVWNGDADGSGLTASLYSVWNGSGTNNQTVKNAWNANGNVIDSKSGANGTIVISNGTTGVTTSTMSFGTGKLGSGAFTFNGSNFIQLPADTFTFTGDFSVSMWVYIPSTVTSDARYPNIGVPLLTAFDNKNGYTNYRGWGGLSWYNNQMRFDTGGYSYGGSQVTSVSGTMSSMNQWVHIVGTRKSASTTTLYVNGVKIAQANITYVPQYNSSNLATIGGSSFAFSNPWFYGTIAGVKIDAVQTWDGIELNQTAVTELYNSGNGQEYPFTVSNAKITSTVDSVGANNGIRPTSTLNSNILGPTFTTGKIGNAFQFDGINDYIQFPNNSMNFTGDFSISAWLYFPTDNQLIGSDYSYILSNRTAVSWATNLAGWSFATYGNAIYFTTYNGTSTSVLLGAPGQGLDRSGWRHIVFTKTGTTYKLWLDGGQYTSISTTMLEPKYQGTIIPKIGRDGDSTMGGWDSYGSAKIKIDSVSVWNRSLNSDEITQLYNAGNGIQYPFSGYLPSSANQFGVDNGTLMNGCTFGDGKIGKAFQFDGVNDYVALSDNSLNLTGDFTIAFWLYHTTSGAQAIFTNLYYQSTPTNIYKGWGLYIDNISSSTNKLGFIIPRQTTDYLGFEFNTALTLNAWNHVIVTRVSGVDTYAWINSNLSTTTYTGPINSGNKTIDPSYHTTQRCTIGAQMGSGIASTFMAANSKIDGLTIWNRQLTSSERTELYNSGNGKQLTATPIVKNGLLFNLDASRTSSYVSGTTWYDNSGNGNNGTFYPAVIVPNTIGTNGVAYWQTGVKRFSFNGVDGSYGSNSYLKIPLSTTIDANGYTFGGWVKSTTSDTSTRILKGADGIYGGWALALSISSTDVWVTMCNAYSQSPSLTATSVVTQNNWYYVICRYNHKSELKLYVNGVAVATLPQATPITNSNEISLRTSPGWVIGAFSTSVTYKSTVSTFHSYNRVLTDAEILQNFNATKSVFGY
jgi:hypothetical protein